MAALRCFVRGYFHLLRNTGNNRTQCLTDIPLLFLNTPRGYFTGAEISKRSYLHRSGSGFRVLNTYRCLCNHSPNGNQDNSKEIATPERKVRLKIDYQEPYIANTRLTTDQIKEDYLLNDVQLQDLPCYTVPDSDGNTNTSLRFYSLTDIEKRAMEVHGSKQVLERKKKALRTRDTLWSYRKIYYTEATVKAHESWFDQWRFKDHEAKSIALALVVNLSLLVIKAILFYYTQSHSVGAEAIHSFFDMCNQLLLFHGYRLSLQKADADHPYGYRKMRSVAALVGGCMLFSMGGVICLCHAGYGFVVDGAHVDNSIYIIGVLAGALLAEGGSFWYTLNGIQREEKNKNLTVREILHSGNMPLATVVIYEDLAAVVGVGIALTCMGLCQLLENPVYDVLGECGIGVMLLYVATRVWKTYSKQLNYSSIDSVVEDEMERLIRSDRVVRAVHDCKTIDMGLGYCKLKAEVDFDGEQISRAVLQHCDIEEMFMEYKRATSLEDFEKLHLKFGDKVTNETARSIDRIEKNLKTKFPKLIHIDIEPN